MRYPEFLTVHDTIGITAPSAGVLDKIESYERSCEQIREQGFSIIETANVRCNGVVSGPARERAEQIKELFERKNVKMILSAAGGDFLNEMLSYLDWEFMNANPKWIQGYSDNTGILFPYTINCDVATIYGPNAGGFDMTTLHEALLTNMEYWKGNLVEQHSYEEYQDGFVDDSKGYVLTKPVVWETPNGAVHETGRLIGGCLDVIQYLVGTPYANVEQFLERYKEDGFIWYFDIFAMKAEECAHVFWQMEQAGWFRYLKAILIGRVCFEGTMLDMSYEDAVKRVFGTKIPLILNADVGHVKPQMTMINGALATIHVKDGKGVLTQKIKEVEE